MKNHWVTTAAVVACSLLFAGQAFAWEAECKEGKCGSSVVASQSSTGKPLLKLTFLFNEDGSNPSLIMMTPLGTSVDAGARLKVDNIEAKLVYKVCYPDGCQAFAKLSAAEWDGVIKAKTGQAQFFDQSNGKLFSADIDLTGLADSVAKVLKK